MWTDVELRELRVFLALAEELHFGHTAERLGMSQPAVSEALQTLETRLGAKLFDRTSRRVLMTWAGEELRRKLAPVYEALGRVLTETGDTATGVSGRLRVGFTLTTEGPALTHLVEAFQDQHPACEVQLSEVEIFEPLAPLRRGEVDVLCNWATFTEPDMTVSAGFALFERVVVMAPGHRLANKSSVSIEDLGDEEVPQLPPTVPIQFVNSVYPPRTPSGRPIHRTQQVKTVNEILSLVARGRLVHVSSSSVPIFHRDDIVLVPLCDMPPMPLALIWCTAHENAKIHGSRQRGQRDGG